MSAPRIGLRQWIPAGWRKRLRRLMRKPLYRGDFLTWQDAERASVGYADPLIAEKVIESARAVRDGHAAWERDTVLFHQPQANEPLLRVLRTAAAANGGRLNVVDFGGALGSTWWQHWPWLADIANVRWSVIEQATLVEAGRKEFTLGPVRFYYSLEECCAAEQPEVILFSSVLPYLQHPYATLGEALERPFGHLIVDRTGFVHQESDRLTVQCVPPSIYTASYPCWFFSRSKFLGTVAPAWRVVEEWVTDDEADIDAEHRGFVLERKRP